MKTEQRTNNWGDDGKAKGQRLKAEGHSPQSTVHGPKSPTQDSGPRTQDCRRRHRAAAEYLSGFLCVAFILALLVSGCAGPRPLKGGKAVRHITSVQDRSGVLPAAGGRPGQPPGTSYDTPHMAGGQDICPAWATIWRAQFGWSATACRCGTTRAVHNNNNRKE